MDEIAKIDRTLDELLVSLGEMVLRLSHPTVTKTPDEREALARSVAQYSVCASRSADPRVHRLKAELEDVLKPRLRLVASRWVATRRQPDGRAEDHGRMELSSTTNQRAIDADHSPDA